MKKQMNKRWAAREVAGKGTIKGSMQSETVAGTEKFWKKNISLVRQITALILAGCLLAACLAGCSGKTADGSDGSTLNEVSGESGGIGQSEQYNTTDASADMAMDAGEGAVPEDSFQTEEYRALAENGFLQTSVNPLSTFSADVDTASYSNVRRMLLQGKTPEEIPQGAVRLEEMVNYFHYDYEKPKDGEPFGVTIDGADCPWQPEHGLLRIGLKTEEIDFSDSPKSNLVFLLDVSGSMDEPNKLPLLKQAFGMLVDQLGEKDRVSIVTYAGTDQVVLDGARGNEKGAIQEALHCLSADGSTNGSAGIETAYALAEEYFLQDGNNRVILATDGDLNIGQTSESQLKTLIEQKRKSGIYLSVLGFGEGNLKDNKLETLADAGNGNYGYIDSLLEARRILVEELGSTLYTVAEDVKFQVEFNPLQISQYRLLGYENRLLNAEDFTNDAKDAGEIGAGHTVTALYEVVWAKENTEEGDSGEPEASLKYQSREPVEGEAAKEWATLKIRYKEPGASKSQELVYAFGPEIYQSSAAEANMLLEASAAEFALLLRDSEYKGNSSYVHILELWDGMQYGGNDEIAEFLELVHLAAEGAQEICSLPRNENAGVSLQVLEETVSDTGAVFLLKNTTEQDGWFGEIFWLEKWENGAWVMMKEKENVCWIEIAHLLENRTSVRVETSWEEVYGKLDAGKYRLEKEVMFDSEELGNVRVKAEFEIPSGKASRKDSEVANEETPKDVQSRPPAVGLVTMEGDTVRCTYATLGSFSWSLEQPDGTTETVQACGSSPKDWEEIAVIKQSETDGTITLQLSSDMQEYTLCYWIENATCGMADPVRMDGDTILLEGDMAKGTYELHVIYTMGDAYYGFQVK